MHDKAFITYSLNQYRHLNGADCASINLRYNIVRMMYHLGRRRKGSDLGLVVIVLDLGL